MKKVIVLFSILVSFLMLSACGSGRQDGPSGTGGIAAMVIWPGGSLTAKSGTMLEKAPAEVRWIRMIVSNGTTTITSSDFDTTLVNSGTLSGIPAGSGWTLTVQGLDNAVPRAVLYQGARTDITVVVSQTTNAGPVAMQVFAPSGTLDKTFNTDGKVASNDSPAIPGSHGNSNITMTTQIDGKIIIAGDSTIRNTSATRQVFLARYNVDGTLDSTFNDADSYANKTPGVVTRSTGSATWANDVTVLPDGFIVAAGTIEWNPTDQNFIMMTFKSDGTYSGGFNTYETDFGGRDSAKAMAVNLPDGFSGTIAVVGTSNVGGNDRLALALYSTSTSSLISKTTTTVHSSIKAIQANDVAFQADGKILVCGKFTLPSTQWGFGVVRFLSDGVTVDTSFNASGTPGMVFMFLIQGGSSTDGAMSVAVQPDGKILIAGDVNWGAGAPQFGVLRFNSDGTKDTTFNPAGTPAGEALVDINNQPDYPYDMKVQPDGKILIAGKSVSASTYFGLARLNANGTIDTSFGTNGVLTVPFSFNTQARAMSITPDGKIVLAGQPTDSTGAWTVTRLWNNTTTKSKAYGVSTSILGVIGTITSTASTTTALVFGVGTPTSSAVQLQGISVDPLANRLYTSDLNAGSGNKVYVVDTISNRTLAAITVGAGPNRVLVDPGLNRLYVGLYGINGAGNTVSVIDTTDNSIVASIPGLGGPKGLALNLSANRLYVGNSTSGTISVIDTLTNTVVATIVGISDPTSLSFDQNTNKLFSTNYGAGSGNTVSVINTLTNAITTNITVGTGPVKTAIDPAASRLYVSNFGGGTGNLVSVISTTSNSVLHTIPTGTGPNSVAIDTTAKKLYVDTLTEAKIYIYDVANDAKSLLTTMTGGTSNIVVVP